jgi:sterol desaturase/sphingolipid hydroxylase (fatty acid hydroxylase superfamily)
MAIFGDAGELIVRLAAFAGVFLVMALAELVLPKRDLQAAKPRRWLTNLTIVGIDMLLVRLMGAFVIPLAAVAAALYADAQGIGLFNWLAWPAWLEIALAVVVLDLAIWFQHLVSHKVPIFWRLHQMHHADVDIDVTTALRFHPIEIALSMLYKIVLVLLLGPAAVALVLFEIILNGCAMFNHANVALPRGLDRILRLIIVTPDFHRVHHSVLPHEHDSNYGFNLSIWDRLFATYTAQPSAGHSDMVIGLSRYQSAQPTRLGWCLLLPFRRPQASATSKAPETRL